MNAIVGEIIHIRKNFLTSVFLKIFFEPNLATPIPKIAATFNWTRDVGIPLLMNKIVIIPYDVIAHADLPELSVDQIPSNGDPIEIKGELYFVCEQNYR